MQLSWMLEDGEAPRPKRARHRQETDTQLALGGFFGMTNAELAKELRDLGDLLLIGGVEEAQAQRYARLAYVISRLAEPVEKMHREGRLRELPGVDPRIASLLSEYLTTGTCARRREFEERVPASALELVAIPGVGAKTARSLYQTLQVDSLNTLQRALDAGEVERVPGIGKKMREMMRRYVETRQRMKA